MASKTRTLFYCSNCGNEFPQWQGRCSFCGQWNTIIEQSAPKADTFGASAAVKTPRRRPRLLKQVEDTDEIRFSTGMAELDRVFGGGAVQGSMVLIGGAPGIGKSTLLLQICSVICQNRSVLYVSGEESEKQLKLRAQRLGVDSDRLYVLSETNLPDVFSCVEDLQPDVLMIDSIQTLYSGEGNSSPGSVSQIRDCTMLLMQHCKASGLTVFIVGHVTKEGTLAGPKILEHMVDCVLYFEGTQSNSYRILRAAKNRFGSTNEIGVFEMETQGLTEVPNPSEMLLSGRPAGAPGTCVACVMEGSRPVLAEVQALVTASSFSVPRRTTDGFDFNRAALLMAVAEKQGGLNIAGMDAYINVIGGLRIDEPAADLPVMLAMASSFRNVPLDSRTAAVGEVGLTGEIRAVSYLQQRLQEIRRLGFTSCLIPRHGTTEIVPPDGLKLLRVRNIREAVAASME